jgi:drug/metabolite transporter (DMT)-like permease
VLSITAVGLMYWLIRRSPATGFASLFYLVPVVTAFFAFILFDERLDSISMLGMVICAGGVALVNRGTSSSSNMAAQSRSKRSQASSPKSG